MTSRTQRGPDQSRAGGCQLGWGRKRPRSGLGGARASQQPRGFGLSVNRRWEGEKEGVVGSGRTQGGAACPRG